MPSASDTVSKSSDTLSEKDTEECQIIPSQGFTEQRLNAHLYGDYGDVELQGEEKRARDEADSVSARARLSGWRAVFVDSLAKCGVILVAAQEARVSRATAARYRETDDDFRQAWDEALESSLDLVQARGAQLATEGVLRPIYQGGKLVGHERQYDPGMIQFFLKTKRRAEFGDKLAIDLKADVVVADPAKVAEIFLRMHPELGARQIEVGQ